MKTVVAALILAVVSLAAWLFWPPDSPSHRVTVSGNAMFPTLPDGTDTMVSREETPDRFDIVVYQFPLDEARVFVGRVVGVPGDAVEVRGGALWINDREIDEAYIPGPMLYRYPRTVIPSEEYFILGDNRNYSYDSHNWGSVPASNILGVTELKDGES